MDRTGNNVIGKAYKNNNRLPCAIVCLICQIMSKLSEQEEVYLSFRWTPMHLHRT